MISIHVPRAGYDLTVAGLPRGTRTFLSTYPVRGTTLSPYTAYGASGISIHVPRAGYDQQPFHSRFVPQRISIHVPRAGYDLPDYLQDGTYTAFLSTYPVRGTTEDKEILRRHYIISIHVPRAGYDAILSLSNL